ncbi:hypothetical protein [Miltoncostaea marina]|uniref:hypothetical protein n=1 Tax=Miltoncostaea marina TaxID=2843215 RepID=UPI001C3C4D06|nr:hypothetical protein [Miltoncostaea marina]
MGPRLFALAALLARRQGPVVAQALLRAARAWLEDPANEEAKRRLLGRLRLAAETAGGAAGRMGGRLAREVERRRVSVASWERDLMALRYEVVDTAHGPVRDAALDAYAAQARAGARLIASARNPGEARLEILRALEAEERMLRGERLGAAERERARAAITEARVAAAGRAPVARRR